MLKIQKTPLGILLSIANYGIIINNPKIIQNIIEILTNAKQQLEQEN